MKIRKIALLFSVKKQIPSGLLENLLKMLTDAGCEITSDEAVREKIPASYGSRITFTEYAHTADTAELILVLGGDGSMLHAASLAARLDLPILGINVGKIGYMAEIEIGELASLYKILGGNFETEERMMLDACVLHADGSACGTDPFLNELVLTNGPISRLLSYRIFCNGVEIGNYRADGVVIATPTGSTAYSLSAGGPIMDPTLQCICITPICPFSLGARPTVFGGDAVLELRDISCRDNCVYITTDGRESVRLQNGDSVRITCSDKKLRLVKINRRGFVNVLHAKLCANGFGGNDENKETK